MGYYIPKKMVKIKIPIIMSLPDHNLKNKKTNNCDTVRAEERYLAYCSPICDRVERGKLFPSIVECRFLLVLIIFKYLVIQLNRSIESKRTPSFFNSDKMLSSSSSPDADSRPTSMGFLVTQTLQANSISLMNASRGVIFSSIETARTLHRNSRMPIKIAIKTPAAKTKNTPPTLSIPSSGVAVLMCLPLVQLPTFNVFHHFSFNWRTVPSSFSASSVLPNSVRYFESLGMPKEKVDEMSECNNKLNNLFFLIQDYQCRSPLNPVICQFSLNCTSFPNNSQSSTIP